MDWELNLKEIAVVVLMESEATLSELVVDFALSLTALRCEREVENDDARSRIRSMVGDAGCCPLEISNQGGKIEGEVDLRLKGLGGIGKGV